MVITKKPPTQSLSHVARTKPRSRTPAPNLHGASIIDACGREIPITETMIQRACQEFIQAWERARLQHA